MALARPPRRISETNDTKTDCIIAQLSPFTAVRAGRARRGDGSVLTQPRRDGPIVDRGWINWRDDVSTAAASDGEF